jgi:hypothetical protein
MQARAGDSANWQSALGTWRQRSASARFWLIATCQLPTLISPLESEFVFLHVDADAAKGDALHLQAESLFASTFARELDRSSGPYDALPWQTGNLTKNADHLARGPGPACGSGYRSIG